MLSGERGIIIVPFFYFFFYVERNDDKRFLKCVNSQIVCESRLRFHIITGSLLFIGVQYYQHTNATFEIRDTEC